jgi:hypothetical protein
VDFRTYLGQLFVQREGETAVLDVVRNFSRWFFDLLRNFVLVGGLKFFYEKSGSEVLFYLHQFAIVVIFLYCLSYADQWYINLFSFLENRRLAHRLNRAVNLSLAAMLFVLIWWAAGLIVAEIAHSQVTL